MKELIYFYQREGKNLLKNQKFINKLPKLVLHSLEKRQLKSMSLSVEGCGGA